jgi:hypothetical protein
MIQNNLLKRLSLFVLLFFLGVFTFAQANEVSSQDDISSVMRSHDKIYVVMAVCVTILVVLFLYLVRIDIKVSKKERDFNSK